MAAPDVDAFLAPVTDTAPCGDDLEYDPVFQVLEAASRGKMEQQFGDTVIAAQEPDWRVMQQQALALLQRTRDLRVAVHLLRAMTRLEGFDGFAAGMRLVRGLLERYWDQVFPQLDAKDDNDPTMRLNALAPVVHPDAVMSDLRAAMIGHPREGISVRQVEVGLHKAEPLRGEPVPTEAGVAKALLAAEQKFPGALGRIVAAHDHVVAIEAVIAAQVGAARGPDLLPLRLLTQHLAQAARAAGSGSSLLAGADAAGHPVNGAAPPATAVASTQPLAVGGIGTRDDALKALDRVCDWITRNEPTNPAPLLIRRAQRLMTKSFMDIIRDIAPEGLKDVERIAGVSTE